MSLAKRQTAEAEIDKMLRKNLRKNSLAIVLGPPQFF